MSDEQKSEENISVFKTPKQQAVEEMEQKIEQCEQEVMAVLQKYAMRLTVIEIRKDARTVGFEIKAEPDQAKMQAADGGNGGPG